jgi:hypothetical protein
MKIAIFQIFASQFKKNCSLFEDAKEAKGFPKQR